MKNLRIKRIKKAQKCINRMDRDPYTDAKLLCSAMIIVGIICVVSLLKFNNYVRAHKATDYNMALEVEVETTSYEPESYVTIELSEDELLFVPSSKAREVDVVTSWPDITPEVETLPEENPDYEKESVTITGSSKDYSLNSVLEYMEEVGPANNIPALILQSIAWKETNFTYDCVSSTDDHGMMQINRCNFKMLNGEGIYDWYDPYESVDAAIIIINMLRSQMNTADANNWHLVLMAYNMGLGGAQYQWSNGVYSSNYSRSIISHAIELGWSE